jgi:hypothetical protein
MPALKNAKHERFCQNIVLAKETRWTNGEAYSLAGYSCDGNAAEACASRLLRSDKVQQRIAEIQAPVVRKAQVTVDSLVCELEANIKRADTLGQAGAINGAVALMAKLKGMLIDRTEVGAPGEFAHLQTREEVYAKLAEELGDEVAAILQDALARREAGEHALVIEHVPATKPNGHAIETRLAIDQMRPKRRR